MLNQHKGPATIILRRMTIKASIFFKHTLFFNENVGICIWCPILSMLTNHHQTVPIKWSSTYTNNILCMLISVSAFLKMYFHYFAFLFFHLILSAWRLQMPYLLGCLWAVTFIKVMSKMAVVSCGTCLHHLYYDMHNVSSWSVSPQKKVLGDKHCYCWV